MVELSDVFKMKINKETITASALIFGYFLSALMLKFILYDNGFALSNILLLIGLVYTRFYLFREESPKLQEGACLILFVLFDRSLLDVGNVFLLLGVACIREQLQGELVMKEVASLICGLIYLLMGWFSAGKILVIYCLSMFYFITFGAFLAIIVLKEVVNGIFDQLMSKLTGGKSVNTNANAKNENEQTDRF